MGRHSAENLVPRRLRRFVPLLAVIGMSLALVGYITGIRERPSAPRPAAPPPVRQEGVPAAVSYAELPAAHLGPNTRREHSLLQLKTERPGVFQEVKRTDEMKQAALGDRSRNRAYDGAPPTIPHPVEAQSAAACLVCHGDGLKIGDRIATRIPHASFSNCTQCHVEQVGAPVETDFVGVYRAGPGQRASPGAPPTIPHHTWLRENCTSCHGLVTRPGTRTTHPWLTNCTQCHAPSAAFDQVDFGGTRP